MSMNVCLPFWAGGNSNFALHFLRPRIAPNTLNKISANAPSLGLVSVYQTQLMPIPIDGFFVNRDRHVQRVKGALFHTTNRKQ